MVIGVKAHGSDNLDLDLYVKDSGTDEAQVQIPIETAHQVCSYSNATRGNADASLHMTVV